MAQRGRGSSQQRHTPRIIDSIVEPTDVHALTNEELSIVADEIREQIVSTTSKTGGHLASSLGAVETIVALHAELSCPHDKIVYDVGHQSYAHKILTGRLARFDSLRTYGGLSGFTNPDESDCDVHYSGHASDSLSIALGLARARDQRGGNERVVALIGDASISGGMAFEALNQMGQDHTRMVVILNDNGMSISPNVGALSRHLTELRSSRAYRDRRNQVVGRMEGYGPIGRAAHAAVHSIKSSVKHLLLPDTVMLYEQLGITCLPAVDGHNIAALRHSLRIAFASDGPVLVHVVTKKGHGFGPAEKSPEVFHSVRSFDPATGEVASTAAGCGEVIHQTLLRETEANNDIIAITAAMADGTGLAAFAEDCPKNFIDVGICEEHAIGLAAGLATGGARPVVAIYSTFLQRAIDQLIVDVALPRLNVVLCVDRAGVAGSDGPTHNGSFDLVYLRMIPNMRILAPSSGPELSSAIHTALSLDGPVAVRYPKAFEDVGMPAEPELFEPGVSRELVHGGDVALLAFGTMVTPALVAARLLEAQGVSARVVDMRWVKPLDAEAIRKAAATSLVVTVEDGCVAGGVGEGVLGVLAREGLCCPVLNLGIPDRFLEQGVPALVHRDLGLDGKGIAAQVIEKLGHMRRDDQ